MSKELDPVLQTNMPRLNFLQILRGVCCVSIIIAHCVAYGEMAFQVPIGTYDYPFRYSMLQCATLFLAMNGFFLTREIETGGKAIIFFQKKFARIFPTYWLTIALVIILRMSFMQSFSLLIVCGWYLETASIQLEM